MSLCMYGCKPHYAQGYYKPTRWVVVYRCIKKSIHKKRAREREGLYVHSNLKVERNILYLMSDRLYVKIGHLNPDIPKVTSLTLQTFSVLLLHNRTTAPLIRGWLLYHVSKETTLCSVDVTIVMISCFPTLVICNKHNWEFVGQDLHQTHICQTCQIPSSKSQGQHPHSSHSNW